MACSMSLAQSQLHLMEGSANFLRKPQNLLKVFQLPAHSHDVINVCLPSCEHGTFTSTSVSVVLSKEALYHSLKVTVESCLIRLTFSVRYLFFFFYNIFLNCFTCWLWATCRHRQRCCYIRYGAWEDHLQCWNSVPVWSPLLPHEG